MNTSRIMTRLALLTSVVLASAAPVRAQPVSTSTASVEWIAANTCLIVHAVIVDVSVHDLKGGLHPYDGRNRYQTVSIRVLETLKGEHTPHLQFVENVDWGRHSLSDLQKDRQEVLLFLEPWSCSGKFDRSLGGYAYTRFPYVVKNAIIFSPEVSQWAYTGVPVLSADLTRLSTSKETIRIINSYLEKRGEQTPPRAMSILLPPELRGGYYQVTFTFPLDTLLDKRAFGDAAAKPPILDFEDFKRRFGKPPPAEQKPPYLRKGSGYVAVYALELMVTDCDAIVRGVIEESCFVRRIDDPTGDWYGVKFRVAEVIKGETPKQITCVLRDARDLEQLRRDEQELILFLRSNGKSAVSYPEGALQYRNRDTLWDDSVIVLHEDSAEALFADLTWHRDPNEILARLRGLVDSTAKEGKVEKRSQLDCFHPGLPVFDVHLPASIAAGSSIEGNPYSVIYLPVNPELEHNARKWSAANNPDLRWLAARALVYFKSDENAEILKGMLDDEATWDRREIFRMTGLPYPHEPEFLVRWESWHVLAGWGYDVPRPAFTISR